MRLSPMAAFGMAAATAVLLGAALAPTAIAQKKTAKSAKSAKSKPTKPGKSAVPDMSPASIADGTAVYQKNGCTACHTISGKGGKTGPELTHVAKTKKPDFLMKFIRDPKKS